MDDQLYNDPNLVQFYDIENGWDADYDYCMGLAQDAQSVLDMGCGTGLFLAQLPDDKQAVGVDPAGAMLEIAKHRPGGQKVTWKEADARTVQLDQRFDLIILTGHAFQVFLTEEDQRAVILNIAKHLTPEGRFVFDSRNPIVEPWSDWKPESKRTFKHPQFGYVEAWNDVVFDAATDIETYQTHYQISSNQQYYFAESKIKFTPREKLAVLLDEAGLAVDTWLSDWDGTEYNDTSPDIIPVGRLR